MRFAQQYPISISALFRERERERESQVERVDENPPSKVPGYRRKVPRVNMGTTSLIYIYIYIFEVVPVC